MYLGSTEARLNPTNYPRKLMLDTVWVRKRKCRFHGRAVSLRLLNQGTASVQAQLWAGEELIR